MLTGVLIAVIAGVLIIAALAAYFPSAPKPAGSVTLNGVLVNVTYVQESLKPWADSTSNCTDRTLGSSSYLCPLNVGGGTDLSLVAFLSVPPKETAFINATIWSPVPFHEPSCEGIGPCPLTRNWEDYNWSGPGGSQWVDVVALAIPSPAPHVPDGFWITANVTADVV